MDGRTNGRKGRQIGWREGGEKLWGKRSLVTLKVQHCFLASNLLLCIKCFYWNSYFTALFCCIQALVIKCHPPLSCFRERGTVLPLNYKRDSLNFLGGPFSFWLLWGCYLCSHLEDPQNLPEHQLNILPCSILHCLFFLVIYLIGSFMPA